jgi:nucleotide-binding universal stress UspA family protein
VSVEPRPRAGALVSIREILFPSDLTPESALAFDHARFLAHQFLASVTLYHAVEIPDARYAHWATATGSDVWERAEDVARGSLEREGGTLSVSHRVLVERQESAARGLLARIQEDQPDLTVMATHGRQGLNRLLLGSVTATVIQHSFRPVLCVRAPAVGAALPYRRILVPTDLSPGARLAFPMAVVFADAFEAEIVACHVLSQSALSARNPVLPTEAFIWKSLQPDFAGLSLTAQVHTGTVWERIVETARIEKVDLIVMSTRGHDSLGDRILGSNTERVVRHAPCPVLVA